MSLTKGDEVIPKNASGPRAAVGAGGREVRFREVLARWPVLAEDWARTLEARRTQAVASPRPGAAGAPPEAGNRPPDLPDDSSAG
jgi:hypothetical protein